MIIGAKAWAEGTGASISSALRFADATLYIGTEGGEFEAMDITSSRRFAWRRTMDGPISADFVVDNNQCFVPCEDMRLYALSAISGEDIWDAFITSGELLTPVQVSPGTIFQYAHDDRLYAIDRLTGTERWNMPDGRTILAVMEDNVYVLDKDNIMHVVDEETGEVSASMDMTGLDLLLSNSETPAIYAATADGRAFCFRAIGTGHLTPAMLEDDISPR
jgi:outer membrane protein assembly factor BamB